MKVEGGAKRRRRAEGGEIVNGEEEAVEKCEVVMGEGERGDTIKTCMCGGGKKERGEEEGHLCMRSNVPGWTAM